MAYVTKELKARVSAEIKKIMPKGTKYSISGTGTGTLRLNIWSADTDLLEGVRNYNRKRAETGWMVPEKLDHVRLRYDIAKIDFGAEWNSVMKKALDILYEGNHDRSDAQVDYFDVGWYVDINLGTWDRPFQHDMLING